MKLVRIGICALVVFGVLAHGGVEDWSKAVLETCAGLLFAMWSLIFLVSHEQEKQIVISPLLPPLVAVILLAIAQILLHATASSYDTRMDLSLVITYAIVLFLATQVFRESDDWRAFIWFIMVFGFLVAVFGILQQVTFNGKLYWFREMRFGGIPFGPYVNRNHFAGFIELVLPVSLVPLIFGKVRRERWFLVAIFALLPIGALFLASSRGGILSFAVELGVIALMMLLRRTRGEHVLIGGIVLLVAFLFVSWLGVKQVLDRFSSLQSLEVTTGKRASMRLDTWHIFLAHPVAGSGLGTLQTVFPAYETNYDGKIVNHAHNDYLEGLAETGILGAICGIALVGALFFVALRNLLLLDKPFAAALHLSGLAACSGLLVHSLVDFNLHIPANAILFVLLAHLATGAVIPSPSTARAPHDFSRTS
jgi:O-antigen ligase